MLGKDLFVWAFGQGSCLLSLLEVLLLPKSQKLNKRGTPPTCFLERYALIIVQFSQQEEVLPLAVELWLSTKLPIMPSVIRYHFISFPSLSPSMLCELGRCAWRKVGTRIWCCDGTSLHSTLAVAQPQAPRWHPRRCCNQPWPRRPKHHRWLPDLSAPRATPTAQHQCTKGSTRCPKPWQPKGCARCNPKPSCIRVLRLVPSRLDPPQPLSMCSLVPSVDIDYSPASSVDL